MDDNKPHLFKKGNPGGPGRPVGMSGSQFRFLIEKIIGKSMPEFILELMDKVGSAEKKIKIMMDLMPYAYSKQQSITVTDTTSGTEDKQEEILRLKQQLLDAKQGE